MISSRLLAIKKINSLSRCGVLRPLADWLYLLCSPFLLSRLLHNILTPTLKVVRASSICGGSFSDRLMCFSSHRVLRTIITYWIHDATWRPWSTILNLRAILRENLERISSITEILGIKLTINIRWASLVSIICIWLARFLISVISLVVLI